MADGLTVTDIATALGISKRSAERRASRESWAYQEESVRGGQRRLYPLASLPAPVRSVIVTKRAESLTATVAAAVAPAASLPAPCHSVGTVMPLSVSSDVELTDKQRLERDARKGVVTAIARLQESAGCSKEAAMTALLINARSAKLEPTLDAMLRLARDPRGRQGDGYPSVRTLKRWLTAPDLTPKRPMADMRIPAWAKDFLAYYQTPQKPSVDAAYREYAMRVPASERPSIHQVRRFLGKLGSVTKERGRMGPRELKTIQPFVRRDFSQLQPNDIWTADGHTFDAEVQHPLHGRPFRPEITAIIDVATRRAVGWSVDLAESSLAVLDALRYGVERHGIPAIFYVDNGSGYDNALMKDEATGLLGRLGITIKHSLPYNSQARGVIERSHQTIWVNAAKMLPSYVGAAMDREARLQQFKLSRQALKKGAGMLNSMPLMPWDLFVQFVEERIAEYNARGHRTLKGVSPDLAWRTHEAKGFVAERLEENELATLFRPRVTRTILRAEINLFTNIYFARDLAEFHGMEAHVAYDIHDPSRIWVYAPDGRFICEAQANGNRRHYMPVPVVEQAREKRSRGRLKRNDAKREEILAELHGAPALPDIAPGQIIVGGRILDRTALESKLESKPEEIFHCDETPGVTRLPVENKPGGDQAPRSRSERSAAENYTDWLDLDRRINAGEAVAEEDARWHRLYQRSAQYRAEAKKKAAA